MLFKLPGAQLRLASEAGTTGAVNDRFVVAVPPFNAAAMTTVSVTGTPVMVAVKGTLLCPAGTVTDPGTTTFVLLSDSATTALLTATAVRVTVQTDWPALLNAVSVQDNPLKAAGGGAMRFTCAVRCTPFRAAVTVAVWFEAMGPAVTVKVALADPLPMPTLAGVVKEALLSESATVTPLADVLVRVAVQVAL